MPRSNPREGPQTSANNFISELISLSNTVAIAWDFAHELSYTKTFADLSLLNEYIDKLGEEAREMTRIGERKDWRDNVPAPGEEPTHDDLVEQLALAEDHVLRAEAMLPTLEEYWNVSYVVRATLRKMFNVLQIVIHFVESYS